MSEYVVTDTELEAVADAIREKGGTSENLEWNTGFISAIEAISGGGGGGGVWQETAENDYAIKFTPSNNGSSGMSGGFKFVSAKRIKVSKIRVFPRGTTTNAYISLADGTTVASVTNATVVAGEWNDLTLQTPVTLEADTEYVVWYSTLDVAYKYASGTPTKNLGYITIKSKVYSTSYNTFPSTNDNGFAGVDIYVDSYYEMRQAVLTTKSITQNGTYSAEDDNADGYSEVTVNVAGGGGSTNILHGDASPSASEGNNGDIYLQTYIDEIPSSVVEWLKTNNVPLDVELTNWTYRTSDKIVLHYKNNGSHSGNWGAFIWAKVGSSPSNLYFGHNFYSGRRCMNVYHGGGYSGDGAYTFDSPTDTTKFYELVSDGSNIQINSGTTRGAYTVKQVSASLGTESDTDTVCPVLFPTSGANYVNVEFHDLIVFRDGEKIHHYFPINGGIIDIVDNTTFTISSQSVTYGDALDPSELSLITDSFLKKSNAWQALIGSNISDVNTGNITFAFIHALVTEIKTVTATDGITTLTKSGDNDVVFAIPNSGAWVISYDNTSISIDVLDYGASYIANFLPITIIQENVGNASINYTYTSGTSLTITYNYPSDGTSAGGIVFDTKGRNFTLSYSGGVQQHGYCYKDAILPGIINYGAGRVSYDTSNPKSYAYNSSYYNFIGVQSGIYAGQTITITIDLTN